MSLKDFFFVLSLLVLENILSNKFNYKKNR